MAREGQLAQAIAFGVVAVAMLFSAEWRWVWLTYLIAMPAAWLFGRAVRKRRERRGDPPVRPA